MRFSWSSIRQISNVFDPMIFPEHVMNQVMKSPDFSKFSMSTSLAALTSHDVLLTENKNLVEKM